ncbi:Protein fantom [Aphelenchoides besseyi]|nr:Protein fantom [Aphelenchoides besseyi]
MCRLMPIVFLFVFVNTFGNTKLVPQCLLRCKDEHMTKMDSEWSMDFAFPILSLLRSNGSEEAAYERAVQICFQNERLENCVKPCNTSVEKEIVQIGLQPWSEICSNLRTLRTQFKCWKYHIETLLLACYLESHKLRQSLQQLSQSNTIESVNLVCANMNILGKCTIEEYGRSCGTLLVQLFDSANDAMVRMLNKKWLELPTACNKTPVYEAEHLRSEWTTTENTANPRLKSYY